MLTNNPEILRLTASDQRVWQGIPSLEVTPNGRIFLAFYSGETTEKIGNYVVLCRSDDDGLTFSEPIYTAYPDDPTQTRCFDPSLWIDPLGRLWLTWAQMPDGGLYAAVCDEPDAAEPLFSEPRRIGWGVMMNKPLVLRSGEWIFPIAVWDPRLSAVWSRRVDGEMQPLPERESGAFAYVTYDNGAHFQRLGGVQMPDRCFDEHMFLEREDGRLVRRYIERQDNDLELLSRIIDMVRTVKVRERESGVALVDRICRRISDHHAQNETVEEMSAALNYSAYYLQHLFQRVTGATILQYRNELRLTKARLLLLDKSFRVCDIAMACGYESHSYFSKLFKREIGITPEAYRRLH